MATIKKTTGAHGNRLEFATYKHLPENCIVVHDLDCQLERTYQIGRIQELDDFEEMEITSFEQVIESWESGKVHF